MGRDRGSVSHAIRNVEHQLRYHKDRRKIEALIAHLRKIVADVDPRPTGIEHASGYAGEGTIVRYVMEIKPVDMEWAFKHGVRFEDGYLIPLKVAELPLGPLSVVVEHEQGRYDYLHVQTIRRPHRGSTV